MKKETKKRAVLVTTVHRGVFFGYATETAGESVQLSRARLCIYWSADLQGFMGLAKFGPNESCKIGPTADIFLHGVTSVTEVSPEAEDKWLKATWKF